MTTLFNLTHYSFLACGVLALLASVYILSQTPYLSGKLRTLAILNLVVCAVSAVLHFYYFTRLQPLSAGAAGLSDMASALTENPLAVRYAYWMATTMMLIVMFPLLMGWDRVGRKFALRLVLADAAMIATGYLGEQATLGGAGLTLAAFVWFSVSGTLWLYLAASILLELRRLPSAETIPPQRDALGYMFFFFLVGWAIFPAGFLYAIVFQSGIGVLLRELTVNIGDIVNKIMWGVLVVYAAREIARASQREAAA
jgi:hypothetical protein